LQPGTQDALLIIERSATLDPDVQLKRLREDRPAMKSAPSQDTLAMINALDNQAWRELL
jgi:hypothetical protein